MVEDQKVDSIDRRGEGTRNSYDKERKGKSNLIKFTATFIGFSLPFIVLFGYLILSDPNIFPGGNGDDSKPEIEHFFSIGDSITAGHPGHIPAEEDDGAERGNEKSQYQYYLGLKLNATFTNLGWGGQTTLQISERIYKIPDDSFVFLQGGMNDDPNSISPENTLATFQSMYSSLTSRGCEVYILSMTPHTVQNWSETYQICNGLLKEWTDNEEITFFELYDMMLMPGSTYLPNPLYYADTVHPNLAGYELIADAIYEIL